MIYTINTRSSILYPLIKSYFKLSETKIYNILNQEFEAMKKHLKNKGIKWELFGWYSIAITKDNVWKIRKIILATLKL